MTAQWKRLLLVGVLSLIMWQGGTQTAQAQQGLDPNRFYHYPYYYFPHNYWPSMGPKWPEPPGAPYQRPPAYMAYPAFKEPMWRYENWQPQNYHRGFHFWLDQF